MHDEQIWDEINRIHPLGETDGCLVFDIGILESSPKVRERTSASIMLLRTLPWNLDELLYRYQGIKMPDTKMNHRYSNHDYVTLSQTVGRKVSKIGYQFVAPIEELNQYAYAVIFIDINPTPLFQQIQAFLIPIQVSLTSERRGNLTSYRFAYHVGCYEHMMIISNKPTSLSVQGYESDFWTRTCYTDKREECPSKKYIYRPIHVRNIPKHKNRSPHLFLSIMDTILVEGFDIKKMLLI